MEIDTNSTLEVLENDYWGEPEYDSHLVTTCHALRKKALKDFEVEDFRILIGQNFSLDILIPFALDILSEDILAEGTFFEGDLLKAVLNSDAEYWKSNRDQYVKLREIIDENRQVLIEADTIDSIRNDWMEGVERIESI